MKKILFSALAVGMLTACSQEEVVSLQSPGAIAFEGAYVDNAVRSDDPSTTTATIENFDVWAFMNDATGTVFNDEDVTKNGGAWSYVNTQYWMPSTNYYFAALSPMNSANVKETLATGEAAKLGLGTVDFTNVNGTEDLLYATYQRTTPADVTSTQQPVAFKFNHLLSKVKFSFTNGFTNDNAFITVKNIKMTAPKAGSIDLAQADYSQAWKLADGEITLAFGDMEAEKVAISEKSESADERLTIPATAAQKYVVTFDVELYMGEVLAYTNSLTTVIEGAALEMGKAYNFHAELNANNITPGEDVLQPIVFDQIEVEEWENGNGYEGGEIVTATPVATAEELAAAMAQGGSYTLTADITINETVNVTGNTTLNLGGKTITNKVENTSTDVFVVAEGATLTIEGDGVVEAVSGNDGYAVISNGVVNINGGTFKSGVDADGAANAVIYARGNGEVYVNGGTFPNYNASVYVLNKKDADRATTTIEVTGGTFFNFNPGNNAAEGAGTNFVKEGYTVSEADGWYTVK